MVFYRKYRPQTISDLDIASVRERLTSILSSKDIPHAFLFTGPKGLGKTSSARILAKAINCEKRETGEIEPCNTCDMCTSITDGSNIDVIEIDAASNRGIDEIRDLRERVKYAPAKANKKIYIIDEVHMLTNEAFNALLKTLEEPPLHVVFVLCTTELTKVPETIISRSFQVQFSFPTKEESFRSIKRVLNGEHLSVEDGVIETIYKRAGGSFRDAAKIVEELSLSSKDGKLTNELLEKVYSIASISDGIKDLVGHMSQKDTASAFLVLGQFNEKGLDFKVITEELLEYLRILLLETVKTSKNAYGLSIPELEGLIYEISESYRRLRFSPIESLPLELVVARWGSEGIQKNLAISGKDVGVPENTEVNKKKESKSESHNSPEEAKGNLKITPKTETKTESIVKDDSGALFSSLDKNFYDALIQAVKQDNHSIAGVLRGSRLTSLADDGTATFTTKFKFHKDKLSENKTRDIIEKRASELLNKKINIQVQLEE